MSTETTPTGIPIINCDVCGLKHPETRKHCVICKSPSLFLSPDTGVCIPCRKIQDEELAAEQRDDFNAAVWAEAYLGARMAYGPVGDLLDDQVTTCPICARPSNCNAIEAWCEACEWRSDNKAMPLLHQRVYEAHVRRRARIEAALKAAGVLPEHW